MIARVLVSTVMLALALLAFWSDALGGGHFLNPIGILLLLVTALVWFAWRTVRAGFMSAQDERKSLPVTVPPSMPAWAVESEIEDIKKSLGSPQHSSSG